MEDNSMPNQDPFLNLALGDKDLYKNHDKRAIEKWIEAQYVKRVSLNVFEISLGRHTIKAHRNQLRLLPPRPTSTTIRIPIQREKRLRSMSDSDEEFYGFPEVPAVAQQSDRIDRPFK